MELTKASVWMLHNKSDPKSYHPVVQILEYSKLKEKNYKFVISDSIFRNHVLGGVDLLKKFESESDVVYSIVKVTEYALVYNSNKPILCLKGLEFIRKCDTIIGDPKPYKHEEYHEQQIKQMIAQPTLITPLDRTGENITARKIPQVPTPVSYQPSQSKDFNISIPDPNTFLYQSTEIVEPQPARKVPAPPKIPEDIEEHKILPSRSSNEPSTPNRIASQSSHLQFSISKNRDLYTPIAHLVPSNNEWIIRARIFSKSEVKHWNNKTSGKLFRCNLVDSYGSEIEAIFFNEGVDVFFDRLQEGKVYTFSSGKVKVVNAKFTRSENDFQLTFDKNGMIVEQADDGMIPYITFQFTNFDRVSNFPANSYVDIIAVVIKIDDPISFRSKTDKDFIKRTITLLEYNEKFMDLLFWNDQAVDPIFENLDSKQDHIIAIKDVKVNEYKGSKNFSIDKTSKYYFNPTDIKDADKLRAWWDLKKHTISYSSPQDKSSAPFSTIKEINQKWEAVDFDSTERASYLLYAFIGLIKDDQSVIWYEACPTPGCKKKVTLDSNGFYQCPKCQKSFEKCSHRYLVNMKICDSTESTWASAFDETAEIIFGASAECMFELSLNDEERFKDYIGNTLQKFYEMKVSVKKDQGRIRVTIEKIKANPDSFTLSQVFLTSLLDCLT